MFKVQSSHISVSRRSDDRAKLLAPRHSEADVETFERIKANCRQKFCTEKIEIRCVCLQTEHNLLVGAIFQINGSPLNTD